MAGRRRQKQKNEEQRPVVTDDFIYDDPKEQPHGDSESFALNSDTPEEAVRKLRRSPRHAEKKNEADEQPTLHRRKILPSSAALFIPPELYWMRIFSPYMMNPFQSRTSCAVYSAFC